MENCSSTGTRWCRHLDSDCDTLLECDGAGSARADARQLALDAGEMGAWQWNLRTDELIWWPGMEAVHGLPPDIVPRSLADYTQYIHPEDREYVARTAAHIACTHGDHRFEYRIVRPDGSLCWIEGRARLTPDASGVPLHISGICMDITRRKRTERGLRFLAEASAELAELVDHQTTLDRIARLAVPSFADWCTVDLLGESGELRRVAAAHIDPGKTHLAHEVRRRFPPRPDMPSGVLEVMHTGRSQFLPEVDDALLQQWITDSEHLAIVRALGLKSYIRAPLTTRGKTLGVVSFVSAESGRLYQPDDLALAEDLARRAAVAIENAKLYRALQEADRRKNMFIATLAHELRNPLAPIVNAVRIAMLASDDRQRVSEAMKLIERQTDQLTRLVDDLMDIARINTGKIELRKTQTTLADILSDAIETSRPHIEAAGHRLSVLMPDRPACLMADRVRLAQVFSNLLNNAAKYTDPGGVIDLTVETAPAEFVVRIRDNGIGISADMLKDIFTAFTQDGQIDRRSQGGLGIGLSLVDELVKLHGGMVEAYSDGIGCGSEFVVRLPRAPVQDEAGCAAPVPDQAKESIGQLGLARRILVVDDNVDGALTIAEVLRMLGHEVVAVHDGMAAVREAAAMRPDTILLDIGMPGIDGYEAARRIREQETQDGARRAMLIALTGWGQDKDKESSMAAGFDQHWIKPVDLDRLKTLSAPA